LSEFAAWKENLHLRRDAVHSKLNSTGLGKKEKHERMFLYTKIGWLLNWSIFEPITAVLKRPAFF